MNRYSILLRKKESLLSKLLFVVRNWLKSWLKNLLLKHKHQFSEYKRYREWYGGKWTLWHTSIAGLIWMSGGEKKPGCCLGKLKEENYAKRNKS